MKCRSVTHILACMYRNVDGQMWRLKSGVDNLQKKSKMPKGGIDSAQPKFPDLSKLSSPNP